MPLGPANDEEPPTGVTPTVAATVSTPAPLTQYPVPAVCRQGLPLCAKAIVSLSVSVPVYVNEEPAALVPGIVSVPPGSGTLAAKLVPVTSAKSQRILVNMIYLLCWSTVPPSDVSTVRIRDRARAEAGSRSPMQIIPLRAGDGIAERPNANARPGAK
jgi:hypothetical protein